MAFDRNKPDALTGFAQSHAEIQENFRALAEDMQLYGEGVPSGNLGQNGFRYIDTQTGDEYLKENSLWVKKLTFADKVKLSSNRVYTGTATDAEILSLLSVGDLYIRKG